MGKVSFGGRQGGAVCLELGRAKAKWRRPSCVGHVGFALSSHRRDPKKKGRTGGAAASCSELAAVKYVFDEYRILNDRAPPRPLAICAA